MIDTIKIYTMIDKKIYDTIKRKSTIKSSVDYATGEIHYNIIHAELVGSYDNSLNIRPDYGAKFGFKDKYVLSIEGSYHKIINGYNSHNGYCNLISIVNWLIKSVEHTYKVKLPGLQHWFLQRIDIAIVFDLGTNENVRKYINNLSLCNYPRRNIKHYQDESIYTSGTTTTLKIYNKLLEFRKHDMKKLFNFSFNIDNYLKEIDGFIRFECEIKKKTLEKIYSKKYVRVRNVKYSDLKNVWSDEFMKLLNFFDSDLTIVRKKEDVRNRLLTVYGKTKGNNLYSFYSSIMLDGIREVKNNTARRTFYRNIKLLKEANVDLSQKYKLTIENETINFNPFEWKEVS